MKLSNKPNRCRHCKVRLPADMARHVLHPECVDAWWAIQHEKQEKARVKAAKVRAAKDKRETKAKLDAIRTKPQLVALAQKAFNGYIRARDAGKPCISCGTPLPDTAVGGAFDCGHYRSVGSAVHMRFVEDNAHGQCKHCNLHLAGNHVAYRAGLITRIGSQRVEQIECDQTLRKYTKEGLTELARQYRAEERKMRTL